ncbi:MAG: branched-chain amino acid ABC transporter permease [Alphaproteobacteria bacterium]|nr:branched-chain amino acid ABC transporter permease [Alphaproteobacteria bacterium]
MTLLQLVINGAALGAAYALVALGFVLILNATNAVNFAQGDLVVAGGFVAVALAGFLPVPGILLLPLVLILTFVLGLAFSLLAYFPLRDRPPVAVFISTIALGIVFQNGFNAGFGPDPRATPPLFAGGFWQLDGLTIEKQGAAIVVTAAVLIVAQHLVFTRTQFGRRLRATAQDRDMARALGVRVTWMIALTFGWAAALAGTAGLLLSNKFFVTPTDGTAYMILAYIAVTIGGWGRIAGAVAGAVLIAVFEVVVSAYLSYTVAIAALYGAVLLVLFFRPQGLFGDVIQRRA